jgi:hypothetical protein
MSPDQLREYALTGCLARGLPDFFGYMSWCHVVIGARLTGWHEWLDATDTERRMFLLLVAEHLEHYWDDPGNPG